MRVRFRGDGSISSVEFEAARDDDTERCGPPSYAVVSEIPPPPPVPSESGVMLASRDTDPHPECMPDDEPTSDKIAREIGWLASNGRSR